VSGQLDGKRGIVTGGARGIGEEIGRAFVAEGASVVLFDRDGDDAEATAESIGGGTIGLGVDVTDPDAVTAGTEKAAAELGGLDYIVNCAGIREIAPFLEHSLESWQRTIDINLTGAFLTSQAAARIMVPAGGGKILNISSMAGHLALTKRAAYVASKGGMSALTKAIASELGRDGINCNAIAPGTTETRLAAPYFEDEEMTSILKTNIPIGRWGTPAEIAAPAVFLCSSGADYISGAVLMVDGGWTAGKGF
jgi:NAD(P)-dependent dehydrogenase (short-subunit alcohol dehydrogenase family)